ncbi:MAG: hypothetical protein ACREJ2_14355, partial [Planctomycetota bacterium]
MAHEPIAFALWWHQHQPSYKDPVAGKFILPWVRLHAIKDYYGMARLIQKVPEFRCQINLVPSMVAQLLECIEGRAQDEFQIHARIPAGDLTQHQAWFLLDHFFMAQWDRMIRVHPGYGRLLALRNFGLDGAREALPRFSVQDLRDLQVWFNLAWFHETAREDFPEIQALFEKGRGFSEDDKHTLFALERQVLERVIPLHRHLSDTGQVELTSTPFYHPILPLLCDFASCKAAMPGCPLPGGARPLVEDAIEHVRRAVAFHTRQFGRAPLGMWPAEGSVSDAIVPILHGNGIRWIGTDEEILERSLGQSIGRADQELRRPDILYQPYRAVTSEPGRDLFCVFRDRYLSDLIGFQYAGGNPRDCAADLAGRIIHQGEAARRRGVNLPLVTIILDGENCWEQYEHNGCEFLLDFYRRTAKNGQVQSVALGEWLPQHSAPQLPRLFPGSWINHDFYIWIGHEEDRKAWEWLLKVRADLERITREHGQTVPPGPEAPGHLLEAWESLFVAEGSDWYWWYGEDHTSGNDAAFDSLFRTHLENVYRQLGLTPPVELELPLKKGVSAGWQATRPTGTVLGVLDGQASNYFEWLGAGHFDVKHAGGVMDSSKQAILTRLYFAPAAENAGQTAGGEPLTGPGLWIRMDFDRNLMNEAAQRAAEAKTGGGGRDGGAAADGHDRPDGSPCASGRVALHVVVRGFEERVYSLEFPAGYRGELPVMAQAHAAEQIAARPAP